MKKILGVLGVFSLITTIGGSTSSCAKPNYTFKLTTEIGEVIDTFDKRSVEDYYFQSWNNWYDTTYIVINFKDKGLKKYGSETGDVAYWLGHLVKGLGIKPNQSKYIREGELWPQEIPKWAWINAGLWDYDHNKPKD